MGPDGHLDQGRHTAVACNQKERQAMTYSIGNEELDTAISALIEAGSDNSNADLIAEIVTTALKLHRDSPDRGELKLINTALKEMRYSNLVFSSHRGTPKVTMYGSARTAPDHPDYVVAKRFGETMVNDRGWDVITGAGPGIMAAGNEGAGLDASFGVNIRLPFEAAANEFVSPDRVINFKYFFTRKLGFVKESSAFALFPGGFGTMDEAFELLTLIQTGKSDLTPIVLIESEGSTYWTRWNQFVVQELLEGGLISGDDLSLYFMTSSPEEAAEHICHFYANYQSQRYVDGKLVLRLTNAPDSDQLAELNSSFADIVADGTIEVIDATPQEVRDGDALESERISFMFDRRQFGRLRQMLDQLNNYVETPEKVHPGKLFTSEQAERAW